ncbi:TrmH family RNA methyltransferase, partial [Patescibacteria group bacterium]|nr:TrmH family RNA methyltransferase [Patescibacteria group bacterium]
VHNVGSIFRTANCLGISNIILAGYTPSPIDRFGRMRKDFSKVALGAEKEIEWRHERNAEAVLRFLKKSGVRLIAVEQSPRSTDYREVRVRGATAFIFGNEVTGLPEKILRAADTIAEIPLRGGKESLNVSVAAGIALTRMLNL